MSSETSNDKRLVQGLKTKQALVQAGVELFAAKGFDAVTTRELSIKAQANIAAIHFHFQGKQGLYQAVIDYVIDELSGLYAEAWSELARTAGPDSHEDEDQAALANQMVARVLVSLLKKPRSEAVSLLLQREIISPTKAFDRIYTQALLPSLVRLAELAARLSGKRLNSLESKTLAFGLFALLSCYSRSKKAFLAWIEQDELSEEQIEQLSSILCQFIQCGLKGLNASRT